MNQFNLLFELLAKKAHFVLFWDQSKTSKYCSLRLQKFVKNKGKVNNKLSGGKNLSSSSQVYLFHQLTKDFYQNFSGMKHASAKTKLYITTYAKFISFLEFMTEKLADQNNGESDFELKVSRKVSSEISSFVKLKQLQDTVKEKPF